MNTSHTSTTTQARVYEPPGGTYTSTTKTTRETTQSGTPVTTVTEVTRPSGMTKLGQGVFLALLIIIPIGAIWSFFTLSQVIEHNPDRSVVSVVTGTLPPGSVLTTTAGGGIVVAGGSTTITTTLMPTVTLGVLDPALGKLWGFFIGPVILLLAAIIETALLIVYGAFFVNNEQNKSSPLGLPQGAVRVFVLIIVILTLLTFALLPSQWGENKAVVFLFGLLSTVVGFYFGSRQDEGSSGSQLTVSPSAGPGGSTTVRVANMPPPVNSTIETQATAAGR